MTERYGEAALRHFESAEVLEAKGRLDDAGYHFGLVGETSLKYGLVEAGIAPHLASMKSLNPMGKHLPTIRPLVLDALSIINIHASGRLAAPLVAVVSDPVLQNSFDGWNIVIRYADDSVCPVTSIQAATWKDDAEKLMFSLVLA